MCTLRTCGLAGESSQLEEARARVLGMRGDGDRQEALPREGLLSGDLVGKQELAG